MAPGATVFTRMFFFARSRAVWRVRLCTAALAEAYTLAPAPPPSMPAIEPTLMMLPPPRFSKCGMAACVAASTRAHVEVVDEVEQRVVDFGDRPALADAAGIVDEHVETAERRRGVIHHALRLAAPGEIAAEPVPAACRSSLASARASASWEL